MNEFLVILGWGAAIAAAAFTLTWWVSVRVNNFSFVDVTWAASLALIVPFYASVSDGAPYRRGIVAVLATLWSLRLGIYLFRRVWRHHPHEDVRYEVLRKKWRSHLARNFFLFFQAQALSIALLSIPMLIICLNSADEWHVIEWIGIGVTLCGIIGETVSDGQMALFKKDKANAGKVCRVGLWSWSRHPNYFFEFVTWTGFWLFACGSPWGWTTIFAPAMILYLLLRVTGIPLTEECAVESKGDAYREYQRTTSAFIPLPPRTRH